MTVAMEAANELAFQRTSLALGRPVDIETVLDLADDLLEQRDALREQYEVFGLVYVVFHLFVDEDDKKKKAELLDDLCHLIYDRFSDLDL
jgi:hypothetical protein